MTTITEQKLAFNPDLVTNIKREAAQKHFDLNTFQGDDIQFQVGEPKTGKFAQGYINREHGVWHVHYYDEGKQYWSENIDFAKGERMDLDWVFGYVTCIDSFMSGWGEARDLTNKLVFACANREEVEIVMANAKARGDMKYIKFYYASAIGATVKKLQGKTYKHKDQLVQIKSSITYNTWYKEGAF